MSYVGAPLDILVGDSDLRNHFISAGIDMSAEISDGSLKLVQMSSAEFTGDIPRFPSPSAMKELFEHAMGRAELSGSNYMTLDGIKIGLEMKEGREFFEILDPVTYALVEQFGEEPISQEKDLRLIHKLLVDKRFEFRYPGAVVLSPDRSLQQSFTDISLHMTRFIRRAISDECTLVDGTCSFVILSGNFFSNYHKVPCAGCLLLTKAVGLSRLGKSIARYGVYIKESGVHQDEGANFDLGRLKYDHKYLSSFMGFETVVDQDGYSLVQIVRKKHGFRNHNLDFSLFSDAAVDIGCIDCCYSGHTHYAGQLLPQMLFSATDPSFRYQIVTQTGYQPSGHPMPVVLGGTPVYSYILNAAITQD